MTADRPAPDGAAIATSLLAWYDRHRRDLPWRAKPGQSSDPYRVWLSEIMLQQTTVAAVKPFFARFLVLWPDVATLAAAPLDDVLKAWAGLGYYSRARNLHACAQAVVMRHDGAFPDTEAELRALPGVGDYTAAAIAAIAFDRRAVVVDGNVERVMARLRAVTVPVPAAKPLLKTAMAAVTPHSRVGDFAQATMDLGATICTPRNPACVICPLQAFCAARQAGDPGTYPRRLPKKTVPERAGAVFFVERSDGAVLLRRRPASGLFGGMSEFPGTAWTENFDAAAPVTVEGIASVGRPLGTVTHGLTHFSLTLHVHAAEAAVTQPGDCRWVHGTTIADEALPTLMRKVLWLVRPALAPRR